VAVLRDESAGEKELEDGAPLRRIERAHVAVVTMHDGADDR
jgi:hypothetical protein